MSSRSSLRQKTRAPKVNVPPSVATDCSIVSIPATGTGNISQPWFRTQSGSKPLIPVSLREDMIRDVAYLRAQTRGFAPGSEVEDWLAAEQEVDELITRRYAC